MLPDVRRKLCAFCADADEVEAGYVCRVEWLYPGSEPEERLSFAMKLVVPVTDRGDARAEQEAVVSRFIGEHPDLAATLGVGVLADRAVRAWEMNAQRVYPEPSGS